MIPTEARTNHFAWRYQQMTTDSALHITGFLLGGLLSIAFLGYTALCFSEGKRRRDLDAPQRFAGLFSLLLGGLMLGTWAYLLATGWSPFLNQIGSLFVHVATTFASSIVLIVAGFGMIRNWSRGPALFMIANGLVIFTTLLALTTYGAQGHPFLMNGVTLVIVITGVYAVGLVYGWEHFVLHLDEAESYAKTKAKQTPI